MKSKKVPVSCVVITKNEEENIEKCLKSLGWADEVIVVDDESTDKTREIAGKFTGRVITRRMDVEGTHRNYAYGLAGNRWVLSLDADEVVSGELASAISGLFETEPGHAAFSVPIKTYLGSMWIRHGGWYPANKVRLFDKERFKYEEVEVHPRVFIKGSCGHLPAGKDIIHYSYRDYHDFFTSLNNQTTLEAKKWFNERRKIGFLKMMRKFYDRFLKSYFLKKGYKDGLLGFVVAYGNSLYQLMSYVKYQFMLEEEKKTRIGTN